MSQPRRRPAKPRRPARREAPRARVRRATTSDLPRLGDMGAALTRLHHAWDPARFMDLGDAAAGYRWWLRRELANQSAVILIGELGDEVAGFAYGRLEERDFSALLDAHGGFHDLWVEEVALLHGLGRALAERMVEALRELGAPRVVLKSAVQNRPAQQLFASLGWRPTMVEMTREA